MINHYFWAEIPIALFLKASYIKQEHYCKKYLKTFRRIPLVAASFRRKWKAGRKVGLTSMVFQQKLRLETGQVPGKKRTPPGLDNQPILRYTDKENVFLHRYMYIYKVYI